MANPHVRGIDRIDDLNGTPVIVGVDHDAVTITIGIHTAVLERDDAGLFGAAFIAACWQAAEYKAADG